MNFQKYRLINKWYYIVTFFSLSILLPLKTQAGPLNFFGELIWSIFLTPLMFLVKLELSLLKIVASYNGFTNEPGVVIGWIALRDLSNMFFILILLVIAFATILRFSSYGYQQLLKRTLIIAILINFSKTIVGFVIDVVQVVMLTFISAVSDIISGGIVVAVGLHKITAIPNAIEQATDPGSWIVGLVLAIIFLIILVVVVGIMVAMLIFRIVALWVAIVLAPLAFLASIFPITRSFYDRWVKELGSNLVSGPMLAFFLWLTFSIVADGTAYDKFITGDPEVGGPTEFLGIHNMTNFIIAIALLLMGIKMAASSGAAGASMASKGMGAIQATAGWAGRKARTGVTNTASRAASAMSESAQDKDGNFKLGFMNKVPLVSKRLQRMGMKAQGYNASRMAAQDKERTKYILPQHRTAFQNSRAGAYTENVDADGNVVNKPGIFRKTLSFATNKKYTPNVDAKGNLVSKPGIFRKTLSFATNKKYTPNVDAEGNLVNKGKITKTIANVLKGGANKEAAALRDASKFNLGKSNPKDAQAMKEAYEYMGNEEGAKKVSAAYANVHTEDSAREYMEENGLKSLGQFKRESLDSAGGKAIIKAVLELYSAKDIKQALATMDDKTAKAILAAMPTDFDKNEAFDKDTGNLKESDSLEATQLKVIAQNAPEKLMSLGLGNAQLETVIKGASKGMDSSKLTKLNLKEKDVSINPDIKIFNSYVDNMTQQQQADFVKEASNEQIDMLIQRIKSIPGGKLHKVLRDYSEPTNSSQTPPVNPSPILDSSGRAYGPNNQPK